MMYPLALYAQEAPPGVGAIINNPAVIGGGIGGILALALLWVLYKSLYRISDRFAEFTQTQRDIAKEIHEGNLMSTRSISETMERIHDDNIATVRSLDLVVGRLDLLLDRTGRTFEQIAIHRGVSETAVTGIPPAIVTPGAHGEQEERR